MPLWTLALLWLTFLAGTLSTFAQSTPPAQFLGRPDRPAERAATLLPPGIAVTEDLPAVLNLGPIPVLPNQSPNPRGLPQTGISRSLPPNVMASGTFHVLAGGKSIWRLTIDSPGASGVRLHFTNFSVGDGLVWIYPADRAIASQLIDGPYTGRGPYNDGTFFSGMIESNRLTVEYFNPVLGSATPPPFLLDFLVHSWGESAAVFENASINDPTSPPNVVKSELKFSILDQTKWPAITSRMAAACHLDVSCYPQYSSSAGGVVRLSFVGDDGNSYVCSGAMINTRSSSWVPYLLTANHCISSASEARSLIAYFQFQTSTCNGVVPPLSSVPKVSGATYLTGAGISSGDYTLLRLSEDVPYGTWFLGWDGSSDAVPIGGSAIGVHHPAGSYKRISFGTRVTDQTITVTGLGTAPAAAYYKIRQDQGRTEGGSSGSPLINASGQIVGTLTAGSTVPTGGTVCDLLTQYDWYGRFSQAYPALSPYLNDSISIPKITSLTPSSGSVAGGTTVTVTGTNFSTATAVSFGEVNTSQFNIVSNTQITAVSPARSAGAVNLSVVTPSGTASSSFTYINLPPVISSINPTSGSLSAGTQVTLRGQNFIGITSVEMLFISGYSRASFTVINDTTIVFTTLGAGSAGTSTVRVTSPGGFATTSFTYASNAPTITSLSPSSGSTRGGALVTLRGTNFVNVAEVTMTFSNKVERPQYTIVDSTTLVFTAPSASGGAWFQVPVTVRTAAGSVSSNFVYVSPAPTISNVAPASGPTTGGTNVVITGTDFEGATSVKFGTKNATSFAIDSASRITAISPSGSAGPVAVMVTTPSGSANASFAYSLPTISINSGSVVNAASFSSGGIAAGSLVSIFGTFTGTTTATFTQSPWPTSLSGITVRFSGIAAPLYYVSPTQINAQVPWELEGQLSATVTVSRGSETTAPELVSLIAADPGVFFYGTYRGIVTNAQTYELISSTNPAVPGFTYLTIYCTGLGAVTNPPVSGQAKSSQPLSEVRTRPSVLLAGFPAAVLFAGLTPGFVGLYQINLLVPANIPEGDAVPLVISSAGKSSTTVYLNIKRSSGLLEPQITSISPDMGTTGGGTVVKLTGAHFTSTPTVEMLFSDGTYPISYTVIGADTVRFSTPGVTGPGAVPIRVTTPGGTAEATYTYQLPSLSGTWNFTLRSTPFNRDLSATVTLSQSGGAIAGSATLSGSGCANTLQLAGSLQSTSLTITATQAGEFATLKGVVSPTGLTMGGSYTTPSSGCTGGDYGVWTATKR